MRRGRRLRAALIRDIVARIDFTVAQPLAFRALNVVAGFNVAALAGAGYLRAAAAFVTGAKITELERARIYLPASNAIH